MNILMQKKTQCNGIITTEVSQRVSKLLVYWTYRNPKWYKINSIKGSLYGRSYEDKS